MSGALRADTRSVGTADCPTEDLDQGREEDAGSGIDTARDAASCSAGVDAYDTGSAEDVTMVSVDEDDASNSETSTSSEPSSPIPVHPRRLRLSVSSGPEMRPQDDGKVGGRDIGGGRAEGAAGASAGASAGAAAGNALEGNALGGGALGGGAPEGSAATPASPAIPATLSPSFAPPRPRSTPPDRARSSHTDTGSREASRGESVLRRMNTAPDLRAASRASEQENSAHKPSNSWHNLAQGASWVSSLDNTHLEALYLPAWRRRARERWRKAINQVKVANYMKVVWKSTSEE